MFTRAACLIIFGLAGLFAGCTSENSGYEHCGNGVLDTDESCDPGIAQGEGSCPNSCSAPDACMMVTLSGSPLSCNVRCESTPLSDCIDQDGCCPVGCTAANDDDCSASCGDGKLDPKESCDGDCPSTCEPADACHPARLLGSADNCTARCLSEAITTCTTGDGCCPAGCNNASDSDCSGRCGDGVLDIGELCDGDCPQGCTDNDACTVNIYRGSVETCNAECVVQQITTCQDGDKCCPANCTWQNDSDCDCQAKTCQSVGATCGSIDDGCGKQLSCGDCLAGKTCVNNQCVIQGTVENGAPCAQDSQCAGLGGNGFCITQPNYKDGYCTNLCSYDNDCPAGSHCLSDGNGTKACMKNCNSNEDCRDGYLCGDDNACWPGPTGSAAVGDPCEAIWQCGGDTSECLIAIGDQELPGGYCTRSCFPVFFGCPEGSVCHVTQTSFAIAPLCMETCVPGSCRPGYACSLQQDVSSQQTYMICLPN